MIESAAIRHAMELREMRVERGLATARAVVMGVLAVVDGGLALSHGSVSWFVGIVTAALIGATLSLAVRHFHGDNCYHPSLKYLTVTFDLGLCVGLYYVYRHAPFAADVPPVPFSLAFIGSIVLVNTLNGFRLGRPIVAFGAALSLASVLAILAPLSPPGSLFVMSMLLVAGSTAIAWAFSRVNADLFVQLRRRDQLTRFLPREIVERVDRGELELQLGGTAREVTVLMSDIRGFTTLSETREPEEIVELLNEYFTVMTAAIFEHGGTIDKFIGDAILAVWGVPEARPDDAERAVAAALGMQRALAELNGRREARGALPFRIGVGLHTGRVVAGGIGSPDRMDYTVIGDAVNVSARIESLTKTYDSPILISEDTFRRVESTVRAEPVADAEIRGRQKHVKLFRPAA